MRPVSLRKSSTSFGKRLPRSRPRYLGLEVAGEPVPALSPPLWLSTLREALASSGAPSVAFRVIRTEGPRAVVEVEGREAAAARRAWNVDAAGGPQGSLRTVRTWGTLVGAKEWLGRERRASRPPASR